MIKYLRIVGCSTWLLGLLQCVFIFGLSGFKTKRKLRQYLSQDLLLISLLRSCIGVSCINFLLEAQSLTQVTIALLLIPFFATLIDLYHHKHTWNLSQLQGIGLSFACIGCIIIGQLSENNREFYSYLTLILTMIIPLSFAIEAQILKKIHLPEYEVIHAQNGLGLIFLTLAYATYLYTHSITSPITIWWPTVLGVMILSSSLSFVACFFFIKLNHMTDTYISTQVNLCIVLLSIVYDAILYNHPIRFIYLLAVIFGATAYYALQQWHTEYPASN